jgi:phytanoyl-CoA hydroxylase
MDAFKNQTQAAVHERGSKDGVPVVFLDDMPQAFLDFCSDQKMTTIIHQLLGPRVEFLSAKPVHKDATITFPSAWHQDYAYWGGATKISVWVALDDATTDNGCLRFIPDAHHELLEHRSRAGTFGNFLDEDQLDMNLAVDAPMKAGDACFFHDLAPHASYGNTSGRDRWSFVPTYRNGEVADSSTVWSSAMSLNG